jgi:hypothetical protein
MDEIALSVFTDEQLGAMRVAQFTDGEIMEIAEIVRRDRVSVRDAMAIWCGEI